jgi:hypothetical protein
MRFDRLLHDTQNDLPNHLSFLKPKIQKPPREYKKSLGGVIGTPSGKFFASFSLQKAWG